MLSTIHQWATRRLDEVGDLLSSDQLWDRLGIRPLGIARRGLRLLRRGLELYASSTPSRLDDAAAQTLIDGVVSLIREHCPELLGDEEGPEGPLPTIDAEEDGDMGVAAELVAEPDTGSGSATPAPVA